MEILKIIIIIIIIVFTYVCLTRYGLYIKKQINKFVGQGESMEPVTSPSPNCIGAGMY